MKKQCRTCGKEDLADAMVCKTTTITQTGAGGSSGCTITRRYFCPECAPDGEPEEESRTCYMLVGKVITGEK